MSVKGSWQRKRNISQEQWEREHDRIFKRKEKRKSFNYDSILKGRDKNGLVLSQED